MNVSEIVSNIDSLAPFRETSYHLVELVTDDSRAISEIADVIKSDANLVANVLRMANSAYYGLRQEVDSIDHAVAMMGSQHVLEIALLSMAAPIFQGNQDGYALKKGELWRHSIVSATFSRKIAVKNGMSNADLVFTAALIKDVGKVILNRYMDQAAKAIDLLVYEHHIPFIKAEKKVLGIDHAHLSALAFEKWNLPEKLVSIVRNHHVQEAPAVAPRETCTIFLGDTITSMLGIGTGKDGLNYTFNEEVLSRYFGLEGLDELIYSLFPELDGITDLINQL
jgi:putative nucleotidyltransferase with HDIG domain